MRQRIGVRKTAFIVLGVVVFVGFVPFALVEWWPEGGAMLADRGRKVFGPRAVAQVENLVFGVQDAARGWAYRLGWRQPVSPWQTPGPTVMPPTAEPSAPTVTRIPRSTPLPVETLSPADRVSPTPVPVASPSPTEEPFRWELSSLPALGELEGEGEWQVYLYDRAGRPVALRTFLQPDAGRPYAYVAVVAVDLRRAALHFVPGFLEPAAPDRPRGDGLIAEEHRRPGVLLAAFNGGFRYANGMFGAMADGVLYVPPQPDKATLVIYRDGSVRIANWSNAFLADPDILAWRQNAPLVIQEGEISARVYNDSITDWGASVSNHIVTRRSAVGVDAAGETLFYFAGPNLDMPSLAAAMQASGVYNGMLLDINNFWVMFSAFRFEDGEWLAEALLPDLMTDKVDRYLYASPVDFFYLTLR